MWTTLSHNIINHREDQSFLASILAAVENVAAGLNKQGPDSSVICNCIYDTICNVYGQISKRDRKHDESIIC